ncbi:MAG: M24 family metallopeptidase, partial [Campylobacterales bacterium]
MAITIKKPKEIDKLKDANVLVAKTLSYLKDNIKAGMSLKDINDLGEEFVLANNARPSFKNLYGFPGSICLSVNEVIIHGVPSEYRLKDGDILGIDLGTEVDGWYGDAAITIPIGG